jgi:hypothetical protein
MNTARQLGTVFGTVVITLVYQPVIELDAVRLGWVLMIAAAVGSALAAVALAVIWASRSGDGADASWPLSAGEQTFIPLVGDKLDSKTAT